jgi:transposase
MQYVDIHAGETVTVYLFVGTLPYSQFSYVEPCLDMEQDTWLRCHVNMFEFFEGSTVRIVCDNLKTGVISHPREGDIVLNANYEALGAHYLAAIMPTGVRKPKQKASVEGTVGKVATAIIARLRNEVFHSFPELKKAVREKLDEFNLQPFQKREHSRYEAFQEEKAYLREIPPLRYEIAEWVYGRKVNLDCHVAYGKNRYSCPYQHVGKKADIKVTAASIEIFVGSERVATHERFPDYIANQYSTHSEDMPDQFQRPEWDDARIKRWAHAIGPHTGEVVGRIFASVKIKEQGYNPSLSVLRLGKKYSDARLEAACELALTRVRTPRYHHLNSILAANQDKTFPEHRSNLKPEETRPSAGYIRGAEYYGGGSDD